MLQEASTHAEAGSMCIACISLNPNLPPGACLTACHR
jgi:hypothetical protein